MKESEGPDENCMSTDLPSAVSGGQLPIFELVILFHKAFSYNAELTSLERIAL